MWCSHCAQEVPALSPDGLSVPQCVRCGQVMTGGGTWHHRSAAISALRVDEGPTEGAAVGMAAGSLPDERTQPPAEQRQAAWDIWAFDFEFRELERTLRRMAGGPRSIRGDLPDALSWHARRWSGERDRPKLRRSDVERGAQAAVTAVPRGGRVLPWLLMWPGTIALTCGVVLLGASWHEARPDLWNGGLALALVGVTAFLLGSLLDQLHPLTSPAVVDSKMRSTALREGRLTGLHERSPARREPLGSGRAIADSEIDRGLDAVANALSDESDLPQLAATGR